MNDRRECDRRRTIGRRLALAIVLVGTGTPASAVAGEDPPPTPAPPPGLYAGVVRLRCPAEGESSVAQRTVQARGRNDLVHFRIVVGFDAELLYARRPRNLSKSRGTDLDGSGGPEIYYRRLPLERGRWLVGCFDTPFSTRDHPREDYALISVVVPD